MTIYRLDHCCEAHVGTRARCQEKLHNRSTYVNGCRCEDCKRAEREYRRKYRAS